MTLILFVHDVALPSNVYPVVNCQWTVVERNLVRIIDRSGKIWNY